MYARSADVYDAIYSHKDYSREAAQLDAVIKQHARLTPTTLLEVGSGTGNFVAAFQRHYRYEGLDISEEMLAVARSKHPTVTFHRADMSDFDLRRSFDVVACLFSSVGYVGTVAKLQSAVGCMARHLRPGGVLLIEPWWTRDNWCATGNVGGNYAEEPNRKIARMWVSERRGDTSVMDMHYLVATSSGVQHFVEHHELALFSHAEYLEAFRLAGLHVTHDPEGRLGRGLYVGVAGDHSTPIERLR
jgi:SAM-dependent methyltransferase